MAYRAEDGGRIIILPLTCGLSRLFFGGLVRIFGFEGIQNVKNLTAVPQGVDQMISVFSGTVHLRLVTVVHLNAEFFHGCNEFRLKMFGIIFVAAPRIRDIHIGAADIFVVSVADLFAHVDRNFAATVIFIPGKE